MSENQSGFYIKVLKGNRGTEYNSNEFNKFFQDEGIYHQLTLEQNEIAERKNRIAMEMVRSMLEDKGLPNTFWAEAVYMTVYLLNRCLVKAI